MSCWKELVWHRGYKRCTFALLHLSFGQAYQHPPHCQGLIATSTYPNVNTVSKGRETIDRRGHGREGVVQRTKQPMKVAISQAMQKNIVTVLQATPSSTMRGSCWDRSKSWHHAQWSPAILRGKQKVHLSEQSPWCLSNVLSLMSSSPWLAKSPKSEVPKKIRKFQVKPWEGVVERTWKVPRIFERMKGYQKRPKEEVKADIMRSGAPPWKHIVTAQRRSRRWYQGQWPWELLARAPKTKNSVLSICKM